MRHGLLSVLVLLAFGLLILASTTSAQQQQPLVIKALAEKKVLQLPDGPLFWRIENFPTLAQAQAVAGLWGLAAESGGKVWLLRLGPASGPSPSGNKVGEVGPLPRVAAPEYLLRINEATGPAGSVTPVHTHPGSEAFYVLNGEQCIRTAHGVIRVGIGRPETGHGADTPMQVSSCGSTGLHALVMFVVDATRPFSSPAILP
jgi:hypothetical protein